MWGMTASVLIVFMILTMPSFGPIWLARSPRWGENIRRAFQFMVTHKELVLVTGSLAWLHYFLVGFQIGILSRQQALYSSLFLIISCTIGSLIALFSLGFTKRFGKEKGSRAFSWFFAIVSLLIAIVAQAIADEKIQALTGFNPQEFSTAQYALSLIYSIWLWMILAAYFLLVVSVIPLSLLFFRAIKIHGAGKPAGCATEGYYNEHGESVEAESGSSELARSIKEESAVISATDRELMTEVVTTAGLLMSALFLIVIAASGRAHSVLESTSLYVLQKSSFFEIGPKMRESVPRQYTEGRIVGDGDMILATDGQKFDLFCYRGRRPDCTLVQEIR